MSDERAHENHGALRGLLQVVQSEPLIMGRAFEADHFNHSMWLAGSMSPVVMIDHFRMHARTFEEHPHAGISAVTLMLEDSPGSMRSIDSLGRLSQFGPGDVHWTQAGPGVTHNQFPFAIDGAGERTIHALQIFVKLPAELEHAPAASFKISAADMARFSLGSLTGRLAAGAWEGLVTPSRVPQPLSFLDVSTQGEGGEFELPFEPAWNAVVLPIDSTLSVRGQVVSAGQAWADSIGPAGRLDLTIPAHARAVVLAGPPDGRPVYSNGPFAYGTPEGLARAVGRYQRGDFGQCPPMPGPTVAWDD